MYHEHEVVDLFGNWGLFILGLLGQPFVRNRGAIEKRTVKKAKNQAQPKK